MKAISKTKINLIATNYTHLAYCQLDLAYPKLKCKEFIIHSL